MEEFKGGISIVGSGNVAWHLAYSFLKKNIRVNSVISRSEKNARELASQVFAPFSSDLKDIPRDSSLILLCVSDSAISDLAEKIPDLNIPIIHTAGSISLSVLQEKFALSGVFYPFQTFSKHVSTGEVSFPVCIEAGNKETLRLLELLADKVSDVVVEMDSMSRKKLHLSGVIVNNFSNFLFTQAYKFLENNDISIQLLLPIINQTTYKLQQGHPNELQTGPAIRGNKGVIKEHLEMLSDNKELVEIYALLSEKILHYYKIKE